MATKIEKGTVQPPSCFQEFIKLHSAIQADTARMNSITAHVSALQAAVGKAREKFHATLELSDFKLWASARAELCSADPCAQEFSRSFGAMANRQAATDKTRRIVAGCLRAVKEALEKQAEEIRKQGADLITRVLGQPSTAEHPAVAELLREIDFLQAAIDRIEGSDSPPEQSWADHNARILDWIRQHEPALLNEK